MGVKLGNSKHLQNIEQDDEWETPTDLFEMKCKEFNIHPELDVSATPETSKCDKFYTINDDALTKKWDKPFFMNPPYSKVDKFMDKAITEHLKYNVDGLILVYAKVDTKWWHKYVEDKLEYKFVKGRIRFWKNGVEPRRCKSCKERICQDIMICPKCNGKLQISTGKYPSVWIVLRKKLEEFC